MKVDILEGVIALVKGCSLPVFSVICIGLLSLLFLLNLTLSIFKSGFTIVKRLWFVFAGLSLQTAIYFYGLVNGNNLLFILFTCVFLFYLSIIFCIRTKERKVKKEERQLINYIDGKIKEGENYSKNFETPSQKLNQEVQSDINFAHVKSVLNRLKDFSLLEADKRQAKELEYAIYECERGNNSPLIKQQISDGLGVLLKIMAKYGV